MRTRPWVLVQASACACVDEQGPRGRVNEGFRLARAREHSERNIISTVSVRHFIYGGTKLTKVYTFVTHSRPALRRSLFSTSYV